MIIAHSYPTRTRGIIVNYQMINDMNIFFLSESKLHFIIHVIYVYLHTQRSSSQIRGANNIFHKGKKKCPIRIAYEVFHMCQE